MSIVKKIDQDQKIPIDYLKKEVGIIIIVMLNASILETFLESMDSTITLVPILLYERMKNLGLSTGIEREEHNAGTSETALL